jgi:hypothetical protein
MQARIARVRQNLFPEVHSQRSYVSVEEEFKRRCSRTQMLLSQRWDQRSNQRVTYYEFLGKEWRLQTCCDAHISITQSQATPSRLGAWSSKSNNYNPRARLGWCAQEMESRLTCIILALATISLQSPKKITQEWSKWGVRGLSLAFRQFWLKNKQERKNERGYGGIYTPSPRN